MVADAWDSGGAYEQYVGRWSRPVAAEFLRWLALPRGLAWADIGCGTGALASAIVALCDPSSVHGVDASEDFVSRARQHVGAPATLRDRRCDASAVGVRHVRRDRVRPRPQLRRRPRCHGARDGEGHEARRPRRGVRLGLRRRHADDAALLGRGHRGEPERARSSTRPSASRCASRSRSRHCSSARGLTVRGGPRDRHPDRLRELRRLLDAVPRQDGRRADVSGLRRRRRTRSDPAAPRGPTGPESERRPSR